MQSNKPVFDLQTIKLIVETLLGGTFSSNDRLSVGCRCIFYSSVISIVISLGIEISPRSAFGLRDNFFVDVLAAAWGFNFMLSLVISLASAILLIAAPRSRKVFYLWFVIIFPLGICYGTLSNLATA